MQYQGNSYGVPWAVENIALLTNKTLSPECPATLDEAVANAKKLIGEGKVTEGLGIAMQIGETGDFYHWYPLFTADGGYAFAQNDDGSLQPRRPGHRQRGRIAAGERLQELANEGIFKASVSYDIARETFAKGKSPYFITGPWQIPEQTEALGDDLMVCPIPGWEGSDYTSPGRSSGVRTFFQTAKAKNADARLDVPQRHGDDHRVHGRHVRRRPAAAGLAGVLREGGRRPDHQGVRRLRPGRRSRCRPSREMGNVFGDAGLAEYKIASGEDPQATLTKAADAINKANAEHRLTREVTPLMTDAEHGGRGAGGRHSTSSRSPETTALIIKIILVGLVDALLILAFAKSVSARVVAGGGVLRGRARRGQLRLLHRPGPAAEVPAARPGVPGRLPALHDGVHRATPRSPTTGPATWATRTTAITSIQDAERGAGPRRRVSTPWCRSSRTARSRCWSPTPRPGGRQHRHQRRAHRGRRRRRRSGRRHGHRRQRLRVPQPRLVRQQPRLRRAVGGAGGPLRRGGRAPTSAPISVTQASLGHARASSTTRTRTRWSPRPRKAWSTRPTASKGNFINDGGRAPPARAGRSTSGSPTTPSCSPTPTHSRSRSCRSRCGRSSSRS